MKERKGIKLQTGREDNPLNHDDALEYLYIACHARRGGGDAQARCVSTGELHAIM